MSTHRNNSNRGIPALVIGVIVLLALAHQLGKGHHGPQTGSVAVQHAVRGPSPGRNPIAPLIENHSPLPREAGTAVAVLVDVSGSMGQPASKGPGQTRSKLEVAKASVLRLVGQIDHSVREHPDRPVVVGIYEFSARSHQPACRTVVPMGPPDLARTQAGLAQMRAEGDTPIGDALIYAKRQLNVTNKASQHILVVTDGENNRGFEPSDVVDVLSRMPENDRAAAYCIAFDIAADRFQRVRDAGGLVLAAMSEVELQQTMDYVLTGKILAEQPEAPKAQ
jgi:hypothetical protein